MMRNTRGKNTRNRSIFIATITACTLLILAVTVFAVASQARSVSTQAQESVQAVENLRVLSLARSEIGLASRAAAAESDETAVVQGAINNANLALDSVEANFSEATEDETITAFGDFRAVVNDQSELLLSEAPESDELEAAEVATGESFSNVSAIMRADQLAAIEGLEADNDLMNLIATISTFIVAFVVPSAALFVFQALSTAPRELRALRLEHDQLQRRSDAISNRVTERAIELRRQLTRTRTAPSVGEIRSELLSFENIASMNGAATSIRNQRFDINTVLARVIDDLAAESAVSLREAQVPMVFADSDIIEIATSELLTNAIVHGEAPYVVQVVPRPNAIEIHVVDNGHGLPEAIVQGAVYDREHSLRDGALEGRLGYGIIAVRRRLEAVGGSLRYERSDGRTSLIASLPSAAGDLVAVPAADLAA